MIGWARKFVSNVCKLHGATLKNFKFCVFCNSPTDTIGDLKKLISAQTGTRPEKIVLKKWYNIYKDHITLDDCK